MTFQNPETFLTVIGGSKDFEFPGPLTYHESSLSSGHGVLTALNTQLGKQNDVQPIRYSMSVPADWLMICEISSKTRIVPKANREQN
jgi:hypothetical protein